MPTKKQLLQMEDEGVRTLQLQERKLGLIVSNLHDVLTLHEEADTRMFASDTEAA